MTSQAALMACSFIGMNNAFAGHAVDDRGCLLHGGLSLCGIASFNGSNDFFNVGTQHRTHAGVLLTTYFGLADAFFCLLCISQGKFSNKFINLVKATASTDICKDRIICRFLPCLSNTYVVNNKGHLAKSCTRNSVLLVAKYLSI